MRKSSFVATLCIFCAASFPAQGEEPVVSIGKQRAARSATAWVVHETDHAHLGPIRFAARKEAVNTATAGNEKILSQVYISCQLGLGIIAQGSLEGSNVVVVEEMIELIAAQRAYEINSRVIRASDEMLQTTAQLR